MRYVAVAVVVAGILLVGAAVATWIPAAGAAAAGIALVVFGVAGIDVED